MPRPEFSLQRAMTDFHRDIHGNLDEPIINWTELELDAARRDPMLNEFERAQIEQFHTLEDPYF
jgi:hypothetical protein